MIRFPDLSVGDCDSIGDSWVLVVTAGGHLFHCSVCPVARPVEFPDRAAEPQEDLGARTSPHAGDVARDARARARGGAVETVDVGGEP